MGQDSRRPTCPVEMLPRRQTLAGTLARRGGAAAEEELRAEGRGERFLSGIKADLARGIYVNSRGQGAAPRIRRGVARRADIRRVDTRGDGAFGCGCTCSRLSAIVNYARSARRSFKRGPTDCNRGSPRIMCGSFCEPVGRAVGGCRRRADRQESVPGGLGETARAGPSQGSAVAGQAGRGRPGGSPKPVRDPRRHVRRTRAPSGRSIWSGRR